MTPPQTVADRPVRLPAKVIGQVIQNRAAVDSGGETTQHGNAERYV